jgi:hypothetical protein
LPDDPNASDAGIDAQPSKIASSALRNLRCLFLPDITLPVPVQKEQKH